MHHPPDEGVPTSARRQRNKERARSRVYAAAVALFSRQGYANTSVAEIAEHADIGRGTFFNHFPRKESLIGAWTQERAGKLADRLLPRLEPTADTAQALHACMSTLSDLAAEEPELSAAMLVAWERTGRRPERDPHLGAVFTGIIEGGRARGEISSSISAQQAGAALHDLYVGALHRWIRTTDSGRRDLLDAELRLAVHLLLHGLAVTGPARPD